jgi:hypothetical protein
LSYYNKDAKNIKKYASDNNINSSNSKFPKFIIVIVGVVIFLSGIGVANLFNNNSDTAENNITPEIITEPTVTTIVDSEQSADNEKENTEQVTEKNDNSLEEDTSSVIELKPTTLSVESIEDNKTTIDKIDIQQISDKITTEKETKTYEFTSDEAGTYRFELSNVPQNIWFRFKLYNSSMEQLKNGSGDNGDGITAELEADSKYFIVVEQGGNTGSFTLNIGSQKPTTDISSYNSISDSTQFTNQKNIYEFTSTEAGTYRFELSDVPQNIWFRFQLYNSSMEQLKNGSGDNGDGITADLEANTKYFFIVEQGGNTGSYTLNIGSQKPWTDISSYSIVNDSIQFTNQKNYYEFTSSVAGSYRFELSNVTKDTWFRFQLYNSSMEQLKNGSGDNEDGITVDLDADTKYYFVVEQGGNIGSYTLNYGISSDE